MSQPFIELYLDENVSVWIAHRLRARGFEVATARDAAQLGRSDEDQLAFATAQAKTLLTHNRLDFERLAARYFDSGRQHHGIIIAGYHLPDEILGRLLVILNRFTSDEMVNQVRYI